jgi:hypothetical protein
LNSSLVNFFVFRLAIFCHNIKVREEGFLKVIETHTVRRDSCSTLRRTSTRISTVVVEDVAMLYVHNDILTVISLRGYLKRARRLGYNMSSSVMKPRPLKSMAAQAFSGPL